MYLKLEEITSFSENRWFGDAFRGPVPSPLEEDPGPQSPFITLSKFTESVILKPKEPPCEQPGGGKHPSGPRSRARVPAPAPACRG